MYLRSGISIACGFSYILMVSSQGSRTQNLHPLDPIDKQIVSKSSNSESATASEASLAMGDSTNLGGQTNPQLQPWTHINRVRFEPELVFAREKVWFHALQ